MANESSTGAYGRNWVRVTTGAPWGIRDSMVSLVYRGRMWVIGGWADKGDEALRRNDVWCSTDGVAWREVTAEAPWVGRNLAGGLVHDDKMWIMGGITGPDSDMHGANDVWYSTDGGNWSPATTAAPWGPRGALGTVAYDNKMWVMGGFDNLKGNGEETVHYNDVWYSTDGRNWTEATSAAPWAKRSMFDAVAFKGRMWIAAGGVYLSEAFFNDVWCSTDGRNWTRACEGAFPPRGFCVMIVYDDKMWLMCGADFDRAYRSDVWCSADGVAWERATADAPWGSRHEPNCVVFDDKLWLIAGRGVGGGSRLELFDDVWRLESPRGDGRQRQGH